MSNITAEDIRALALDAAKGKLIADKLEDGYYTAAIETKYASQVDKIAKRFGKNLQKDINIHSSTGGYGASIDVNSVKNALNYLGATATIKPIENNSGSSSNVIVIEFEIK